MRKIEERMINAVINRVNYRENNTKVYNTNKGVFVYLYETIIYAKVNGTEYYSDGGYNTTTTSSRLRALGAEYSTNEKLRKCVLHSQDDMKHLLYYGRLKQKARKAKTKVLAV